MNFKHFYPYIEKLSILFITTTFGTHTSIIVSFLHIGLWVCPLVHTWMLFSKPPYDHRSVTIRLVATTVHMCCLCCVLSVCNTQSTLANTTLFCRPPETLSVRFVHYLSFAWMSGKWTTSKNTKNPHRSHFSFLFFSSTLWTISCFLFFGSSMPSVCECPSCLLSSLFRKFKIREKSRSQSKIVYQTRILSLFNLATISLFG